MSYYLKSEYRRFDNTFFIEFSGVGGKGSHRLPKRMFFYTLCKRPLTPPSVLHDLVADFSDGFLNSV